MKNDIVTSYKWVKNNPCRYTLSESWSGVKWADLMAAQGAFGTDFYDRSTRTIVGTMLWTEYRPVNKIGPKGALGSHEIRPIHSAPSHGQSIERCIFFSRLDLSGVATTVDSPLPLGSIVKKTQVLTLLLNRRRNYYYEYKMKKLSLYVQSLNSPLKIVQNTIQFCVVTHPEKQINVFSVYLKLTS